MTTAACWLLVALGMVAVASRRPAPAAVAVGAQTILVGVVALLVAPGHGPEHALAGSLLLVKGALAATILALALRRSGESRPPDDGPVLPVRLLTAAALVVALEALIPSAGLASGAVERAAVALVAIGLALTTIRRATLMAVVALLVAENGIALGALWIDGGLPLVIELGIAFDVLLVVGVAAVLQRRIIAAVGTSDAAALGRLRG